MKNSPQQVNKFTEQEQPSVIKYGVSLINIHDRLVVDGYFLNNGKIWNIFKAGVLIGETVWEDNN